MSLHAHTTPQTAAGTRLDGNPVFCAFDMKDAREAAELAQSLAGLVGGVKIGMEFFYRLGRDGYATLAEAGLPVFLDLKLHDIPNTVAEGLKSLGDLSPAIVNVHAGGGLAMMQAARDAVASWERPGKLIAVTVLTSLDDTDMKRQGVSGGTSDQVLRLADLAAEAGLDGVVCSAHDIERLRAYLPEDFLLVVPGLRPAGSAVGDQKRVATPAEAYVAGADVLVVGRPITAADDPAAAARAIAASLAGD